MLLLFTITCCKLSMDERRAMTGECRAIPKRQLKVLKNERIEARFSEVAHSAMTHSDFWIHAQVHGGLGLRSPRSSVAG